MEIFQKASVCLVALTAAFWDIRKGKIPNALIAAGLICGGIFQIVRFGVLGSVFFLGSALLPVVLFSGLFYFRMIGAGDVKLLAVLGGFLGPGKFCACLICTLVMGGILSLGLMLYRGNPAKRLRCLVDYFLDYLRTGQWRSYRQETGRDGEFPLAVPVLFSVLCYVGGLL